MLKTLLPILALLAVSCVADGQTLSEAADTMATTTPLTIERLYASPDLSGPKPLEVKYSPDGMRVTFLKARADESDRYDLWQFDVATGEQSLLVDSKILEPEEVELSEEEKALRERKRIAGRKGILSYDWGTSDTILVPLGGNLHLVTVPPVFTTPEIKISLLPSADELGVSLRDIAKLMQEAYFGEEVQRLPRDGEDKRVAVRQPDQEIPSGLYTLQIETTDGGEVPLMQVAEFTYVSAPDQTTSRQLTDTDAFEYDAKISPGGKYVSFVRDGAVYAVDLASGEEQRLTPLAEPDKAVSYGVAEFVAQEEMDRYTGYWWSPDERYLAYTRVDESSVDIIPRFEIAAEDVTVIEQRYPRAGRPNAIVDLFVRDMETGEVVEIGWRRDDWGPATDQYLARVGWHLQTLFLQAVNRDQTIISYQSTLAIRGWSTVEYTKEEQSSWVNLGADSRPIERGRYVIRSSEETGMKKLVANLDERTVLIGSDDWAVDELKLSIGPKRQIYFTGFKDTPLERHLYKSDLFSEQITRITELGKSWTITMAPDGQSFVGTSSSPDQPPQTGLYRIGHPLSDEEIVDMGAERLPDSECLDLTPMSARVTIDCPEPATLIAWIEENALNDSHPYAPFLAEHTVPEYGTLEAEDGQTLYYSIQKPPGFDASKKYPVLVEVYGGPGVQTVTRNWEKMGDQFYSRQGYIVFRLDNRGSSNRGKKFEDVIYHRTGGPEVRDQLVGVDWLKAQPFVDADRIAIQGWSYGGYMTLMTILQAPEGTFAAAVAGAPVTDWSLYDTFYTERYMGTPQNNPDGYEASSVFPYIDNLTTPLLLVHGMADDNVTFDNTTRLMAALQEKGKSFELMTYPGQRHGIRGEALQIHLMKTRMAFLDRHLKDGAE